MFNTINETLRVPSLQLRSLRTTLSEQHGHLSYRERDALLPRQLENDLERVNLLWNNFQEVYALETNTLALNREQADLTNLLRRVLKARPLNRSGALSLKPRLCSLRCTSTRIPYGTRPSQCIAACPRRVTSRHADHGASHEP